MRRLIFFITISMMIIGQAYTTYSENMHMHHDEESEEIEGVINTICPVMAGEVTKDTPYRIEYEGKMIGFCCPGCIEAFKANPEEYMKKLEENHEPELSGVLEEGVRVIEVEAFQYGFKPDPIVVKAREDVRIELTSTDVIHGLAISELGINFIAKPGEIKSYNFTPQEPGTYHIYCSIYCGPEHGDMHGELVIVE